MKTSMYWQKIPHFATVEIAMNCKMQNKDSIDDMRYRFIISIHRIHSTEYYLKSREILFFRFIYSNANVQSNLMQIRQILIDFSSTVNKAMPQTLCFILKKGFICISNRPWNSQQRNLFPLIFVEESSFRLSMYWLSRMRKIRQNSQKYLYLSAIKVRQSQNKNVVS